MALEQRGQRLGPQKHLSPLKYLGPLKHLYLNPIVEFLEASEKERFYAGVFCEIESFVSLLFDELEPKGVISLRFSFVCARDCKRPSLLGCHEVQIPVPQYESWCSSVDAWALRDRSGFVCGLSGLEVPSYFCTLCPSGLASELLSIMGLKNTPRSLYECWTSLKDDHCCTAVFLALR